jgi:hypothetical protein
MLVHSPSGYLTGDMPVETPLLSSFEVLELLPFDVRRLRAALREHSFHRLEVKVRGTKVDPAHLLRQLRLKEGSDATLLIIGSDRRIQAAIARRMP